MTKSKILVVDDELIGRQLLQAVLLPEGFEIIFAENGNEAINAAKEHLPNLILMDVMMPDMDGYETILRIRDIAGINNIPIIMVTALEDRDSRIRGLEVGAVDYITKPFDRAEIVAKIRNRTLGKYENQPAESSKSKTDSNELIINSILSEIINPLEIAKQFSGYMEISFSGDFNLKAIGQWLHKCGNMEYLCLFGPELPDEQSNLKNCLISMWLWNSTNNISSNPISISNFILSKMSSSGIFNLEKHPWWFTVIIKTDKEITGSGFNIPAIVITDVSGRKTTEHSIYNHIGTQLMRIDYNMPVFLISKNFLQQLEEKEIIEELNKHITNPESATFNSTYESLLKKADSENSVGIKIGFKP